MFLNQIAAFLLLLELLPHWLDQITNPSSDNLSAWSTSFQATRVKVTGHSSHQPRWLLTYLGPL